MNRYPGNCSHCAIRIPQGQGQLKSYEGMPKRVLMCNDCFSRLSVIQSIARNQTRFSRQNPHSEDNARLRRLHVEHETAKGAHRGKTWGQKPTKPNAVPAQLGFKFESLRESIPDFNPEHFEDPENRGWVSPDGKFKPLDHLMQTHYDWVRYHHPDVVSGKTKPRDAWGSMIRGGWIRKVARNYYETTAKHAPKVHAHVQRAHPDVTHSLVIVHGTDHPDNPWNIMDHGAGGSLTMDRRAYTESCADQLIKMVLAEV